MADRANRLFPRVAEDRRHLCVQSKRNRIVVLAEKKPPGGGGGEIERHRLRPLEIVGSR